MKKWILGGIGLSVLLVIIIFYVFHEAILLRVGRFMAPSMDNVGNIADAVIVDGDEFIKRYTIIKGINVLRSGAAKRLVIVMQQINQEDRPFGVNEDYFGLVRKDLEGHGLKEKDFKIIMTPWKHPLTMSAAKTALDMLSREGVKSAILVSDGFHTRRSYLTYQYVGESYQMKIIPQACFKNSQYDKWWSRDKDLRSYIEELSKLTYYMLRGYIPMKFSY